MRTSKVRDQLQRAAHEIISEVNIGSNTNKGPKLAVGTPVRSLEGVLTNNPGFTALSDSEIEEFSFKYNSNCIIEGRENPDYYCRLQFTGDFSLNTICYSIMKPCRCTVEFHEDYQVITTSWFTAMHSVTKLISRMREDGFKDGSIYMRIPNEDAKRIKSVTNIEEMIDCLKICEKVYKGEELVSIPIVKLPRDYNEQNLIDLNNELKNENEALKARIIELEGSLKESNELIEKIRVLLD